MIQEELVYDDKKHFEYVKYFKDNSMIMLKRQLRIYVLNHMSAVCRWVKQ
jgi:hypothetical protein